MSAPATKGNLYMIKLCLFIFYKCFPPSFFFLKRGHTHHHFGGVFFFKKNSANKDGFFFSKECVYIFRKLCFELVMNLPGMTSEDEESPI